MARPVALITGARRGIGRAIGVALAKTGYDIAFTDIAEDEAVAEARKLFEEAGATARFFKHDVAAIESHAGLVADVKQAFGRLDLFVSNMHANSAWALFHPDFPTPIPWRYRLLGLLFPREVRRRAHDHIDRLSRGSTLFRSRGDGTFEDVSDAAGVRDGQWGWAAAFLDYDNDARLDLYAVNGYLTGDLPDDV